MIRIRNPILARTTAVILIAGSVFIAAFRTDIKTATYAVEDPSISSKVRIALISDLHSCDYGLKQREVMDALYAQAPDIVLLGGDIVDDRLPHDKARDFLSAVSEKYDCFYVSGNHEYWSGDSDGIKRMIEDDGITVLEGESCLHEVRGQRISISGVDDFEIGEAAFDQQLARCAEKIDNQTFSILLTHRPEQISRYLPYGFDLILSGHAHGGQWRIPGILNGLLAPDQGFFPPYAGGEYGFDDARMIVSRGLAKESTRIPRIFNQPEIVIVDINPQEP